MGRKERTKRWLKEWCVKPFVGDAFEKFSEDEDSESCGKSWDDFLGDSSGLSGRQVCML